ncbi:hypothetical protein E2C01_036764 [Portunus trituberculatus]|uniref:Uncharacterized protein n=1 Tax=Portunus trituberculatus TaxID=210409 RepID=A0A5B7FC42_PORTR|nr:hypothetical protein [Portunus trituberculatus]
MEEGGSMERVRQKSDIVVLEA